MINRVILLVIDGFGIGALPDAAENGQGDADTLAHLADAAGGVSLPNLETLGLGHVAQIKGVRMMAQPTGSFGRLGFSSPGSDSVTGYWEICGVMPRQGTPRYASGVPAETVARFEQTFGRKVIGARAASMTAMLRDFGAEHLSNGAPVLWTDGAHTCYLGAHESVIPASELHRRCRDVRRAATGPAAPVRIVAQPFGGEAGSFRPLAGRKDYVVEPPGVSMLDLLHRANQITMGIGKVYDLFSGRGFTRAFPAASATAAFDETVRMTSKVPRGLLCASLDLFPEDTGDAATALQEFDRRLPELFDKLRVGDLLVLTGDHGRDLSRADKMSTREYVPILLTGPKLAQGVNVGTRATAADLGQTIVDALRAERLPNGESFIEALRPG